MRLEQIVGTHSADDTTTPMTVQCTSTELPRVLVAGEVDAISAGALREAVREVVRTERPRRIEMDLGDVTFLDSAGIRSLVYCHGDARQAGCEFVLADMSRVVHRVLDISGLLEFFGVPEHDPETT